MSCSGVYGTKRTQFHYLRQQLFVHDKSTVCDRRLDASFKDEEVRMTIVN